MGWVKTLNEMASILADLGSARSRMHVVQAHGAFDLLHPGHVRYLQKAKRLGDMLVVTVTSDQYVNKGPGRPLVPEALRAEALTALACVDYAVINDAPTAIPAIRALRPDVYVKGEEYRNAKDDPTGGIAAETDAVAAIGGRVEFLDDPVRFSSTAIARALLPERPSSGPSVPLTEGSFFAQLSLALAGAEAETRMGRFGLGDGTALAVAVVQEARRRGRKLLFVGNGGSAATCSHMAEDWLKVGHAPALAFNDGAQLTCLANDLGFANVFAAPVAAFAEPGDVLWALSVSGESENVIVAVLEAQRKHCTVISLSGLKPDNSLRKYGELRFWVPSDSYGVAEVAHLAICHATLDQFVAEREPA